MIADELKSIIAQIKKRGKMNFIDGTTKDQIARFEKEKGIILPAKYKEWLLFSDGGEFFLPGGVQMHGIAHKPIIDADDDDRPNDGYVVIGALAMGDPVLCEKDGEKIAIYNHGAGRIEKDEIYDDFTAFLKDLPNLLGIEE